MKSIALIDSEKILDIIINDKVLKCDVIYKEAKKHLELPMYL